MPDNIRMRGESIAPADRNHLCSGLDGMNLVVFQKIETDTTRAGKFQFDDVRTGEHRQARVVHHRAQKSPGGAAALTVSNIHIDRPDALGPRYVHIANVRHA